MTQKIHRKINRRGSSPPHDDPGPDGNDPGNAHKLRLPEEYDAASDHETPPYRPDSFRHDAETGESPEAGGEDNANKSE